MTEYSVLIIDDDIWMQRILSKTLQNYGFKKSFFALNGIEGMALAVEHNPTLIICDILMPELSGHLVLKLLKAIKLTKNIPVLMVSALSDVENLGMAVKSGSAGFISKPFTRATVYEKLVNVFGREELDLIIKGEILDSSVEGTRSFPSNQAPYPESEKEEDDTDKNPLKTRPFVTQDKLLQHYQDDEKKSIESIKKMLLRNKKTE